VSETVDRAKDDWVRTALGIDPSNYQSAEGSQSDAPGGAPGAAPGKLSMLKRSDIVKAVVGVVKKIGAKAEDLADEAEYLQAVSDERWGTVAEMLNKVKTPELKARMTQFSTEDMDALYAAACADPKVGKKSAVAMFVQTLSHPVLGSTQKGRAADMEEALSPADQKKYKALLTGAKTQPEKDYITKGLAAKHSVAELEKFAKKIAGKNADWLRDNLSLTGASNGSGVKQQWHDSCGPTTFEAVQGELDPLYALKMHEENSDVSKVKESDGTKVNKKLAADQKSVLTGGGGIAVDRDKGGGEGMWIAEPLNKISGSTGLKYDLKKIPDEGSVDDGVKVLNDATAKGEPVPISIGNGAENYQHYVLVTASDPGPPRYYTIHDPWDGKTVIRSEEQMRHGALNIAGCNDLESFDKPTPVPVKGK
jgi:hypothetical protein